MRRVSVVVGTLVGVAFLPTVIFAQSSLTEVSILRVGDEGPAVLELQRLLNGMPDTQVAAAGPGSPGMETSYFGAKTENAVSRFQTTYASEVLVPAGVSSPTGIAGLYTLKKLRQFSATKPATPTPPIAVPTPPITTRSASTSAPSPVLPVNNFESYVAEIKKLQLEHGVSVEMVELIEQEVRTASATTTDLVEQFFEQQRRIYLQEQSQASSSVMRALFNSIAGALWDVFMPATARAAVGLPFGGYITYVNPLGCTCTPGITQLFVALPNVTTTSNLLLNYVTGTQAFQWYNLPRPGLATLGEYAPGGQTCYIIVGKMCWPLWAHGQITPMVGSSSI